MSPAQPVRPAGALADVPPVHAVVHELEHRVEEGRQRPHELVRDLLAAPLLRAERRAELHHLVQVGPQPLHRLTLGQPAMGLGALVEALAHHRQAERPGHVRARGGRVKRGEVAFRHVDQVTDDVPDFPPRARGRRGPGVTGFRQPEQRLGFQPDDA